MIPETYEEARDLGNIKNILKNYCDEIMVLISEGGYRGYYFILLRTNNQFAYIHSAYGSCSGCDLLQNIIEDFPVDHLLKEGSQYYIEQQHLAIKRYIDFVKGIQTSINWKTLTEMKAFILNHDYEGSAYGSSFLKFKEPALKILDQFDKVNHDRT